ncbi:hypothetical protein QYM36_003781, partial [Artemia franciscana]
MKQHANNKGIRLKNWSTGEVLYDTLHSTSNVKALNCRSTICTANHMNTIKEVKPIRTGDAVLDDAKKFIDEFYASIEKADIRGNHGTTALRIVFFSLKKMKLKISQPVKQCKNAIEFTIGGGKPGMITFSERFIFVQENSNLIINVHRINGHDGDVSVRCRSLQQTAESGTDFLGGEQILSFHDQGKISVPIQIMMTERNFNRVFEIELSEPGGGATIGPIPRMAVSIKHDDAFTELMKNRIPTSTYLREFRMHNKSFFSRIRDAVIVNDGDAKNATAFDWCIHVFAVVWKVEVWEGLVTVLLFPLLVISAYLTEKRGCPCLNQTKTKTLNQNGNQIIDEPSLQQSEPGMITFSERFIFVQENSNLIINVHRINGHDGDVSVRCRSLQQTAESGTDFLGGEQILSFHDQ